MRRRVGSPNASVIADTAAVNVVPAGSPPEAARGMTGIVPIRIVQIGRRSARPATRPERRAAMPVTPEQLIEALRPVEDPELHRSIVDLGMVRRAELDADGVASVLVALTVAGCPLRNEIQSRVDAALLAARWGHRRRPRVHGDDRSGARGPAGQAAGQRPRPVTHATDNPRVTPPGVPCRSTSRVRGPVRC